MDGLIACLRDPLDFLALAGLGIVCVVAALAALLAGRSKARAKAELKRTETELRQTRAFFNAVIANMPMMLTVKTASDQSYVLVNHAAEHVFKVSAVDMIGKRAQDLLPADEAALFEARDREVLNGRRLVTFEHDVETPSGNRRVIARKVPILSDSGEPQYLVTLSEDITERKRADEELCRTRAFLDTVINNMPVMVSVKDAAEHRFVLANKATEQLFGVPQVEMFGKRLHDFFAREEADFLVARDCDVIASRQPVSFEHAIYLPDKGTRIFSASKIPIVDADGTATYLLTLNEDITERRLAEERIAHMAHHDALTDLPNRAHFADFLGATFDRAARSGAPFAVLSIDLDRFKEVNDLFGHSIGDELLREVAHRLRTAANGDYVARLGGDEFMLISRDGPQPATAEALAERLFAAFSDEIPIDGQPMRIGISIGVAVYPSAGADATTILAHADAALYRAKSQGRNAVKFYEAAMDSRLRERRSLQHDLQLAIERGELSVHYQPQATIARKIRGFEALVRWQHPRLGMVPPTAFIPIAEESGLIMSLGEWVLRSACSEAASWVEPLQVAVNFSPIQFRHGDLPSLVHQVLLETGLAPSRLEIEITEGVLIDDFSRAVSILRRLKALGVRVAMDDFGTGYSSLSYLQSFPFDKIKIDKAFISNLDRNPQSAAIVRAVIGLGRGLDVPIVAEGVETDAQLAFLCQEGCDEVQGYLIGRPERSCHYARYMRHQSNGSATIAATR
jgi:diguanylate cyclase (GGDEF)-like protein/PAS domain S-box-containing protein